MNRIVLYKGQSQYDVLRSFIDQIASAFRVLNYETVIVDLIAPDVDKQLRSALSLQSKFVFSFNLMGVELQANNQSIYDLLNTPFFGFLVDSPLYHIGRLNTKVDNLIISCVDNFHTNFLSSYTNIDAMTLFLPHGGCVALDAEREATGQSRIIDIMFAGGYSIPQRKWRDFAKTIVNFMDDIVDYVLWNDDIPIETAAAIILDTKNISLSDKLAKRLLQFLPLIDKFIRAQRREKVLRRLAKAGLKIDVYGHGWEQATFAKYLCIHKPLSFPEMLKEMCKAKMVLNIAAILPRPHERVFSAMLNGAVAVTNVNKYWAEEFTADELVTFAMKDLRVLPDRLAALLADPARLDAVSAAGRAKAERSHTWLARAQKIVEAVELFRVLRAL